MFFFLGGVVKENQPKVTTLGHVMIQLLSSSDLNGEIAFFPGSQPCRTPSCGIGVVFVRVPVGSWEWEPAQFGFDDKPHTPFTRPEKEGSSLAKRCQNGLKPCLQIHWAMRTYVLFCCLQSFDL